MRASALRILATLGEPPDGRYHWELYRPSPDSPRGDLLIASARRFRDRTAALANFAIVRAYMMEADIDIPTAQEFEAEVLDHG